MLAGFRVLGIYAAVAIRRILDGRRIPLFVAGSFIDRFYVAVHTQILLFSYNGRLKQMLFHSDVLLGDAFGMYQ